MANTISRRACCASRAERQPRSAFRQSPADWTPQARRGRTAQPPRIPARRKCRRPSRWVPEYRCSIGMTLSANRGFRRTLFCLSMVSANQVSRGSDGCLGWLASFASFAPICRASAIPLLPAISTGRCQILQRHSRVFFDAMEIDSAHVVGAKLGGAMAMQFAADYPKRTRTLVLAGAPCIGHPVFNNTTAEVLDKKWVTDTQHDRLGSAASKDEMEYWNKMMSAVSPETQTGINKVTAALNMDPVLPRISAPTLVITTDRSSLAIGRNSRPLPQRENPQFTTSRSDERRLSRRSRQIRRVRYERPRIHQTEFASTGAGMAPEPPLAFRSSLAKMIMW